MLLSELIERIERYEPRAFVLPEGVSLEITNEGIGKFSKEVLERIVGVAARTIAVSEDQVRIAQLEMGKGTLYDDLPKLARDLGLDHEATILERAKSNTKWRPKFFGMSRGLEIADAAKAFLAAKHFADEGRVGQKNIDMWFDYYRNTDPLLIALAEFFPQGEEINPIDEIYKVAVGDARAMHTSMVSHAYVPALGITNCSTQVGSNAGAAMHAAIQNGPVYRDEVMRFSPDSVVHLCIGDASLREPSYASGVRDVRTYLAGYATARATRHGLSPQEAFVKRADVEAQREWMRHVIDDRAIGLEVTVLNNGVGITTRSDFMHPFDVLDDLEWFERRGVGKLIRFETIDFLETLEAQTQAEEAARNGYVVGIEARARSPAGHTASNFRSFETKEHPGVVLPERLVATNASDIVGEYPTRGHSAGSTWFDTVYHDNYEPLHFALTKLIDLGYIDKERAIEIVRDAQRASIQSLARVVDDYQQKGPTPLKVDPKTATTSWQELVTRPGVQERRERWLTTHMHTERMNGERSILTEHEHGLVLPEQYGVISPKEAERLAILEQGSVREGNMRGNGQDVHDVNLRDIPEALRGAIKIVGGIDKVTKGIQLTLERLFPGRGRHYFADINGINEEAILQSAHVSSILFGGNCFSFAEIQFLDYLVQLCGMENISTAYQKSNGREITPLVVRAPFGFCRGQSLESIFSEDGAGGMYHAASNVSKILADYGGWNVAMPTNSRDTVMAYRQASATGTPTFVLMSPLVMRTVKARGAPDMKGFPYETTFPEFGEIDPFDKVHFYGQHGDDGELPMEAHEHFVIAYGEYTPVSYMVAERIKAESGRNVGVIDYCIAEPGNPRLIDKVLANHPNAGSVNVTIVSPEDVHGFGTTIQDELLKCGLNSDRICTVFKKRGTNPELNANHLIYPHPEKIYETIVEQMAA